MALSKFLKLYTFAATTMVGQMQMSMAQTLKNDPFQDTFPTVESFEEITAITRLHMSSVYGFDDYYKPLSSLWKTKSVQDTDVALLMAAESKRIYLVFRGTELDFKDISTILQTKRVRYGDGSNANFDFPAGRVHKGFNKNLFGADKLYLTLDAVVKYAMSHYGNYELVIIGHSLGGALAILYGAHVAKNVMPDRNILVQSIGTPRVGDETFKNSLRNIPNLANWRVVYERDLVPRIPLDTQGYRHAGHLIYLNDYKTAAYFEQTGDYTEYAGVGSDDFLLPSGLNANTLTRPLSDHKFSSYARGLSEAKQRGLWPTEFVPFAEQEKVCCDWFLVWCVREDYPPCE
mmetsp:Transcript_30574/g.46311  ORF Transcript_30574/g.46311 Transcript_30574/m.46311 type:complete len:346 (-) Transcript_30574:113-1150(-)|eukprot:CAMPEP_0178938746 /NCGR_PEP_ID=MMETSP0786-20121207/26502_1 /TAXON_ID=186022 /ORGANISM="Thalassionema frauenfeldii, Strain CCMP 1798" /LENGTH=345 /DNA_ID=CAMNT_0020617499 /DNA_START=126 /DNA_END=1163 /DNA_ORIENTATION=+